MRWLTPADYEFYGFWGPESDGRKAVEDHISFLEKRKEKYKNTLIDKDNEHVKILKERGWVVISNFFTEKGIFVIEYEKCLHPASYSDWIGMVPRYTTYSEDAERGRLYYY